MSKVLAPASAISWFDGSNLSSFLPVLARSRGWDGRPTSGRLGANPIEVITHSTGDWILIFLLVTLSITPLRKANRTALADSLSPHVRSVRILLRDATFRDIYLAGQVVSICMRFGPMYSNAAS